MDMKGYRVGLDCTSHGRGVRSVYIVNSKGRTEVVHVVHLLDLRSVTFRGGRHRALCRSFLTTEDADNGKGSRWCMGGSCRR